MEAHKPLITGDKVKEILNISGLKTEDLEALENVKRRQAFARAKDGMNGLAAVCLLLLEKHPELLPEIWELAGHPEKAEKFPKK
jgi:hypothetical protein